MREPLLEGTRERHCQHGRQAQVHHQQERRETWDGRDRWTRFRYREPVKIARVVVDPDRKLALDVDPANNSWTADSGVARRAALKLSARFLLWLQNLLELHTVLG